MTVIKNIAGTPFDVQTLSGPAIIDAFGTLDAEFDSGYLDLLVTCGSIVIDGVFVENLNPKPLEDRVSGDAERYEELTGKKPDGRWSADRLASELAKIGG